MPLMMITGQPNVVTAFTATGWSTPDMITLSGAAPRNRVFGSTTGSPWSSSSTPNVRP